jgi:uncharacterized integral membrane protein
MRRAIVYLTIALLIGILTLQNRQALVFHIFFWTVPKVSSSLVIIGGVLFGAVVGASFRGYGIMKSRRTAKLLVLTHASNAQNRAKTPGSDS